MKKILLLLVLYSFCFSYTDKPTDSLVLTDCTEDISLTSVTNRWYASSGSALAYDVNGFNGNRGIIVTSVNNVTSQARMNFSAPKDISGFDLIKVSYKMEDSCKDNSNSATYDFRLYVMTDLTNLRQYYVTTKGKLYTRDNWYTVTFRIDKHNASTGTLNLASVSYIMISATNRAADGELRMTIGKVSVCDAVYPTGYFVISLDGAEKSMLTLGKRVFDRYNCKPTMYHIPSRYQASQYMTWAEVDSVYRAGWEVGHMGYSHANFDTLTPAGVRSEIQRGHDTLAAHGIETRRLFAFPFGAKSRAHDTVATEYTDVRRGTTGLVDIPGISADGVYTPMATGAFITNGGIIQTDTNASGRWSTIKIAIDSAVSRKVVTGVIIHKFRDHVTPTTGVDMDTATLDTMLHYLDSLRVAGVISYGGIGRLFTPFIYSVRTPVDTLKLKCSVNNATGLQWYRNGIAITDSTDSVLTVYADSAAYRNKYVYHCQASNILYSLRYGDWTLGMSGNKRVFYFKRKY
jgi:hypothetical protein